MNTPSSLLVRHGAWLAAVLVVMAALSAGAPEGYSQLWHPLALLGAMPLAGARAFNLMAFVGPGLLAAIVAWGLRAAMSRERAGGGAASPWVARVGAQLMLVSALAFVAQGVFPLDAGDLDGGGSSRHASAWMVWWLAATVGALLLAFGLRRGAAPRSRAWRALAAMSLVLGLLLPALAVLLPHWLPAGLAQRLALVTWLAWLACAGHAATPVNRGAA